MTLPRRDARRDARRDPRPVAGPEARDLVRRSGPPSPAFAGLSARPLALAVIAAWPLTLPLAAAAQDAAGTEPALEPVVISVDRRAQRSFDAPAAVSTVDARTVREAGPQVNLSEALVRVPGISVLNRQNYAQDLQLSIRGFGARSTFGIRGVRLVVDGIPATMPDGQGQASTISLPSVERIEVLRGPLAQLHGNAAGGVVLVSSRVGMTAPVATIDTVFAPWDTQKVGYLFAMGQGEHAFLFDASQFRTGGWRDHGEASRGQANLRWRWTPDADTRVDLVLNALDQTAKDPLGLTRAQWEADPQQTPAIAYVQDPRKTVRQSQAGVVLERRLSPVTTLQARAYTGERSLRNALSVPLANQQSVTSSGGIVEFVRPYDGVGLLALHRIVLEDAPDGRPRQLRLGVGVDLDRMREDRQGYLNSGGVAGALKRDEDNLVRNRDVFVQAGWDLTGSLALDAGVRRSSVRFRTEDHFIVAGPPANPDDSGSLSYTATSPVLGLTWRASPDLNVYGNVGRGFETPTFTELAYRSGGLTGLNTDLKAGRSRHAEVGAKWRLNPAQRLDLAVFDIRTTDDLVVDTNTGGRTTYRNATRTRRSGVEAGWSAAWGPTLSSQVTATVLRAVFDAPFTSGTTTVPSGNRLPGVPAHNAFAGLDWRPAQAWGGFNGGVEVVRQGRIAVNDANSDAAPAATLLNLRAGFGQRVGGWELRQDLRLENATDERYAGSVIVNEGNQRFFEPAMPRSVMLRISATVRP